MTDEVEVDQNVEVGIEEEEEKKIVKK